MSESQKMNQVEACEYAWLELPRFHANAAKVLFQDGFNAGWKARDANGLELSKENNSLLCQVEELTNTLTERDAEVAIVTSNSR